MNRTKAIFLICLLIVQLGYSTIKLPALISDHMVIQRDEKVNIWGWANPNEQLKVSFNGKDYSTIADFEGNWLVTIPPTSSGGPYTLTIVGESEKINIENILVGDVWLCSGQSNMVHQMSLHSERYADDIATANYPEIRQFAIPTIATLSGPADDISGASWKPADSNNVLNFSVVAYFFAKRLYDIYHVPIGLINASVGGSPIETWMSEEGFKEFPKILQTVELNKDTVYVNRLNDEAKKLQNAQFDATIRDKGLTGANKWYDPKYEPKNWQNINIPGYWEDQGVKNLNGVVWYRRVLDIPQSMTGVKAKLVLGRIVDANEVYINGVQVGKTTYQYPQRRYEVPADLLKVGKNLIVVKVVNHQGKGGFVPDKPYGLVAAGDTIDLKGTWQYKVGEVFVQKPNNTSGFALNQQPTVFYNGMIAPVVKNPIKGILWYQGESNADRSEEYTQLLPALIANWRKLWGKSELPFLYVQLPGFMDVNYLPEESNWALLRESQSKALSVANTAMTVAIDLGEWNDIHPDNKKPIGDRLSLAAQKLAYGEKNVVYSGPLFKSAQAVANKIELSFDHVGSGLTTGDGEELSQFAIAGEDGVFVWANAKIEGTNVVVWNDAITQPMYVKYAWADNPFGANLYNKEGLPASPFRVKLNKK